MAKRIYTSHNGGGGGQGIHLLFEWNGCAPSFSIIIILVISTIIIYTLSTKSHTHIYHDTHISALKFIPSFYWWLCSHKWGCHWKERTDVVWVFSCTFWSELLPPLALGLALPTAVKTQGHFILIFAASRAELVCRQKFLFVQLFERICTNLPWATKTLFYQIDTSGICFTVNWKEDIESTSISCLLVTMPTMGHWHWPLGVAFAAL